MAQIKSLSAELQKLANEELGEVPSRISADLQAIKSWIKQQPHLRSRTDDQFLIQFLRGCKYSLERAKEKLDRFYTLKSNFPDLFNITDVTNPRFRHIYNMGCYIPLAMPLNDHGPRIVVMRYNYNAGQQTIEELHRPLNVMHELMLLDDPYACIGGLIYILDMSKSTVKKLLELAPGFVKKMIAFYEKSIPLRIKAIYCVNLSPTADQFIKFLLPFFSQKMQQRFHICSGKNLQELTKDIPLKYLPKDYGGENGTLEEAMKKYGKKFAEYEDYLKENAEYGTDEKLRPGKPIDFDSMFGMGGSFRKLDVD